ncbi:MAG: hydrolase [Bacteroidetes bacterium]|nr:MAG: hydrolase [Bacteroidota bacterium]
MKHTLFVLFVLLQGSLLAQPIKGMRQVRIVESPEAIRLDGVLDEPAWQAAERADKFHERLPFDTLLARARTEVMLTYDRQFLYIGAVCHDELEGKYAVTSLRRDFETFGTIDFFSVILDPFSDQTNGLEFTVNPYNVQREALISNGGTGRRSTNSSWDNKWFSKVSRHPDKWVVEMAIPFKTLRFREGSTVWRINFARNDSKQNERTNWTWIPRAFRSYSLAHTGELIWDKPLRKPGTNLAVIPYLTGGKTQDYEENSGNNSYGFGGDVKIGVSSSLNLDLTINPDFSQVEVDRQVTNLDRFEISFPERRQFFLENNDLFANFGSSSVRPFFTRRIGIAKNTETNLTERTPILYGARLSGRLDKNWRVGLLNMQTAADDDPRKGIYATNYSVGVIQRQVFKRSNISAIFINKYSFIPEVQWQDTIREEDFEPDLDELDPSLLDTLLIGETPYVIVPDSLDGVNKANNVVGLDYNHASADGKWNGKLFYHQSLDKGDKSQQFAHGAFMGYNSDRWEIRWDHEVVGEDYNAEVGFVRRRGYQRISPSVEYKMYPKGRSVLQRHGFEVQQDMLWSNGLGLTDRTTSVDYIFRFLTGDYVRIGYENDFVKLTRDFDPTRTDGPELPEGSSYTTHRLSFLYFSDSRRKLSTFMRGTYGQYYNGMRAGVGGEIRYRLQPYGVFSVNYSINRVQLPDPYHDATLLLIGPKIDLTFTNTLFFSTLVQYNNQINNVNINARFQWRFKPVSDLFIVYTDNYFAEHLKVKNRGIVFKLTYWLNI